MEIMDGQQKGSNVNRLSLDKRFGDKDHSPSVSELHHRKATIESQDNGMGLQLPMTATAPSGQQAVAPPVTAAQDCNGHQASPSHSMETTANVSYWTSEELQHLSIYESAGAQQRITDKASRTIVDSRTAEHDTQANAHSGIGSVESRLAALRGQLDFNEVDDFASSNVDLFGQRSAPPSASASGESSAGHPNYASSGGPKVVDVNLQVDLGNGSVEEDTVTCRTDTQHRFNGAQRGAFLATSSATRVSPAERTMRRLYRRRRVKQPRRTSLQWRPTRGPSHSNERHTECHQQRGRLEDVA